MIRGYKFVLAVSILLGAASFFYVPTRVLAVNDSREVNLTVTCPDNICEFRGCTDRAALNYDPDAGYNDGSCKYIDDGGGGGGGTVTEIRGCTDPAAINYNAKATINNGSCRYNVPNVSNFKAAPAGAGVELSWKNPANYAAFDRVIIVRSSGGIPTGLSDGEIVYSGSGESVIDNGVEFGVKYYYLAVVKNIAGLLSSGALASIRLEQKGEEPPPPPPVIIGPEEVEPPPGGPGGPGVSGAGIFDQLPPAVVATATLGELPRLFILKQSGERDKPFYDGSYVKVKGNKPLTISVDYFKLPETLKTVGLTLTDRSGGSFSLLLRLNNERNAYEATVGPLPEDGVYTAGIYLINFDDRTIRKWTGQIAVVGSLGFLGAGPEKFVRRAGPVAVTGGALAGLAQLLFSSGASLSEFYLLLLRQLGTLLGYLGFKKKNRPWGTVYDSVTKRPIDPAYVSVLANGTEIAAAITDIDGRYGFSLLDGNYSLVAAKTHYRFPSVLLAGQREDAIYRDLYFGEPFYAVAGEVVSKNIPLDPVGFDWNEFVKSQRSLSQLFAWREIWRARLLSSVFMAGFAVSLIYLVFKPGIVNILVALTYGAIFLIERYVHSRHKTVVVRNAATGEPIPFAIVRCYYAELGQEARKVVADMIGRFYLLVRPGVYYVTVDHKQPDGSYARIYQSPPTQLTKGIWDKDILI